MARTTSGLVRGITETDTSVNLNPFIDAASSLVERLLNDPDNPSGHSSATLELIETWLAAHFYRIRDMIPASEKAGSVGESKQFKVDLGLHVTVYGQQALMLDTSGILASYNDQANTGQSNRVGMRQLGKTAEQLRAGT